MRAGRGAARPAVEVVGALVEQLAVLVSAGIAPSRAWVHLAEVSSDPIVMHVAAAAGRGVAVSDALLEALSSGHRDPGGKSSGCRDPQAREAWRTLAAAWHVAVESGAPMRHCLLDIAEALRAMGGVDRQTAAALAGPTATTRLVLVLPAVSLLGSTLLGIDALGALTGTPVGAACLAIGLALILLGRVWSRRLLRRAGRGHRAPGLALDLIAVAVAGGGSLPAGRALVEHALTHHELPAAVHEEAITAVLSLSARSGAPPAQLLRSEAARLRRDAISEAERRAAALGVWLMLPLGLCVLPAFVLLALVPVLLGVLTASPLP
jgi:tight adherence protein B